MSTLQIWLSYNNEAERLRLPVMPETIGVDGSSFGYEDVEIAQFGEYTIPGNNKLKEFSISSFFPKIYNASYCEYQDFPSPLQSVAMIERWKESGKPIRLKVTGANINVPATIRNFSFHEQAGSPGDLFYELELKEYKFITFSKVTETNSSVTKVLSASNSRPSTKSTPTSYSVKAGDSLWKISKKVYDDGDKWRTIYNANKSVIGNNYNDIKVGMVLLIP